jgi:hypothetical protein
MFAPHHERVADELVRVCRPNGTIGLITFTPEGIGGEFFALLAPYLPSPPPGAEPPLLWGRAAHVHALFDNRVSSLVMTRHTYVKRAPSPEEYARLFMDDFGPVIAIRANLDGAPERLAAFDRAFTNAIARWNRGRDGPSRLRTNICSLSRASRKDSSPTVQAVGRPSQHLGPRTTTLTAMGRPPGAIRCH